jgi:hypothetical protein
MDFLLVNNMYEERCMVSNQILFVMEMEHPVLTVSTSGICEDLLLADLESDLQSIVITKKTQTQNQLAKDMDKTSHFLSMHPNSS